MPEYPGGPKEMMKFIQSNVKYPEELKNKNIGGKVFVKFVVDTLGKITSAEIIKSAGFYQFDDEALRVINLMPTWNPGTQNEKKVRANTCPKNPKTISTIRNIEYKVAITMG